MNLLDLVPAKYRFGAQVAAIVLLAISIYATGRHYGAAHVRGQWDAAKVEQLAAAAEAESTYRQREQSLIQQLQKAQYDAAQREAALRAAADAATDAAGSLRHELTTIRGRLSEATAEACRATAGAALELLGTCADEYRSVAAAADGHASDAKTLSDAWPK